MILENGMVTVDPTFLLAARDALLSGNTLEAYHQLRMAVDADGRAAMVFGDSWHDWEFAAKRRRDAANGKRIAENRAGAAREDH